MPKRLLFILLLTLIFALLAPNFAYKAALATEGGKTLSQGQKLVLTASSTSPEDAIKKPVQSLMNEAQNKLQQGFEEASRSVQEAAKAELDRQIALQARNAKKGMVGIIKDTVKIIEDSVKKFFSDISNWFIKTLHINWFKPKTN